MGYKPGGKGKLYNVVFEDKPGLVLVCRGTKLAKLFQMQGLKINLNEVDEEKKLAAFKFFSDRIVRWNMEHPDLEEDEENIEGVCVFCGQEPGSEMVPSVQSLLCLELGEVMGLIFGYMSAMASVSIPKEMNSNSGETTTQEAVMRRLAQEQSLGTLSEQNSS